MCQYIYIHIFMYIYIYIYIYTHICIVLYGYIIIVYIYTYIYLSIYIYIQIHLRICQTHMHFKTKSTQTPKIYIYTSEKPMCRVCAKRMAIKPCWRSRMQSLTCTISLSRRRADTRASPEQHTHTHRCKYENKGSTHNSHMLTLLDRWCTWYPRLWLQHWNSRNWMMGSIRFARL